MSFIITEKGFDKENIIKFGNKFLIGNGYMGFRGVLEEYTKDELVALNILGLYDQHGDLWREPVNAPNGFFAKALVDGKELSVLTQNPENNMQQLDISTAHHTRKTEFKEGTVTAERFLSRDNIHIGVQKFTLTPNKDGKAEILIGIDTDVWDINGPHLTDVKLEEEGNIITATATTGELKLDLSIAKEIKFGFDAAVETVIADNKIYKKLSFDAKSGENYTVYGYFAVFTDNDDVDDVKSEAIKEVEKAKEQGYNHLFAAHKKEWDERWDYSDVIVEGDDEAQLALRYSIYHLLIIAPRHSDKVSIPARGLSGQTYKGAIFWDTEMFMLPFFLHTDPQTAKNLIRYRVNTLDGAREKAKEYGFRGAFYAWESQERGNDACSDYNITDVFTGRPMRTYFRDKQVHISADVAYAIWETYEFTGDPEILVDGGAEVILECARFFYSYCIFRDDKDRYEIIDVIGPDEYHERVANNAYTSKMVEHTFKIAIESCEILKSKYPDEYSKLIEKIDFAKDLENIKRVSEKLYVPSPNKDGLIEQFEGYFKLEDCTVDEVRSRLKDDKEYWGGAYGVASDTKVIKQADVVLMLNLFKNDYSVEVKKKNWEYYEPRTEHGSSLSPCIYALLACECDNQEWGYPYFMRTASVDLTGNTKQFAGLIYIGGTHPAANGGAWMSAVLGFAGLNVVDGKINVNPKLPAKWKRLKFNIVVRGERYAIDINEGETKICKI
jgi:trehalose/maltose hydrolase-like predicted phosphorylase